MRQRLRAGNVKGAVVFFALFASATASAANSTTSEKDEDDDDDAGTHGGEGGRGGVGGGESGGGDVSVDDQGRRLSGVEMRAAAEASLKRMGFTRVECWTSDECMYWSCHHCPSSW